MISFSKESKLRTPIQTTTESLVDWGQTEEHTTESAVMIWEALESKAGFTLGVFFLCDILLQTL